MVSAPVSHPVESKKKSVVWGIPAILMVTAALIVLTAIHPFKPTMKVAVALASDREYKVPLRKGTDHLYHIDRPALGADPVAIEVTYYTGRPYPGAGTFDAHPFLIVTFTGESGRQYKPDLTLGNLNCSQGKSTTQRLKIRHIIDAGGVPVALGVRTSTYQDVIIQKVELVMPEPEVEDPYA